MSVNYILFQQNCPLHGTLYAHIPYSLYILTYTHLIDISNCIVIIYTPYNIYTLLHSIKNIYIYIHPSYVQVRFWAQSIDSFGPSLGSRPKRGITWTAAVNVFADYTDAEFKERWIGGSPRRSEWRFGFLFGNSYSYGYYQWLKLVTTGIIHFIKMELC